MVPWSMSSAIEPRCVGDDRGAAGHGLDDAVSERFVEVDQMEQGVRRSEHAGSLGGAHRSEVADLLAVDVRLDLTAEVLLVLDDAGDVEPPAGSTGHLDRRRRALVGMDAAEEQQVVAWRGMHRERSGVDAVVDRGGVVERRVPVGVADRDVVRGGVVALVHGKDPR